MSEANVRYTPWLRRTFGTGRYPQYEIPYMGWKALQAMRMRGTIGRRMESLQAEGCPIYRVELDLVNRCNMDCSFCAQSVKLYREPLSRMSDSTFLNVCSQLGEMGYSRSFYLSCIFEPWMDFDLIRRARIAREMVPNAYLLMFTNGLAMTPKRYHSIMGSLDFLFIDSYADGRNVTPAIAKVTHEMTDEERDRTVVYLRLQDEMLDTIGGASPSRHRHRTLDVGCTVPFSELYIGTTGEMYLCSKDVKHRYPMGNVNEAPIWETWRGEEYRRARETLLACRREEMEICRRCDFIREDPDETHWLGSFEVERKIV